MNKIIFFLIFCSNVFGFGTGHLPLADELQKNFPKLFSKKFIIGHEKSNIIVHGNIFDTTLLQNGFEIQNSNGENFKIALLGWKTEDELRQDIEAVKSWLSQFFAYKVLRSDEMIAEIPVFYGTQSKYKIFTSDDHYVLLSKNQNRQIKRTFVYRTMLSAPFSKGTKIGTAFYKVCAFQKSIAKDITTLEAISKSNRFFTILDSLSYVIFGSPFEHIRINKSEEF